MIFISLLQTVTEDTKREKKNDQPPEAKKPKVKTKTVELPIENNLQWQLSSDVLNMFVENEVMLHKSPGMSSMPSQYLCKQVRLTSPGLIGFLFKTKRNDCPPLYNLIYIL